VTWAWIALAVAFIVIEGVALFNSTRGDTLSEHVWAWIGVRTWEWGSPNIGPHGRWPTTPIWTLRVARTVLVSGLLWLTLHLTTGWV
jgi:hypothetical protein